MNIAFLVCANGFGHFERVTNVIHEISRRSKDICFDVFCQHCQFLSLKSFIEEINRINWHFDCFGEGITWRINSSDYHDNQLVRWEKHLSENSILRHADLVVSDNMAGVLSFRSDSILMGSFLWSDVLEYAFPNDVSVASFVEHERYLLERHKPYMLCLKDLAMPGVIKYTKPVLLPWMCQSSNISEKNRGTRKKVAFLTGATGVVHDRIVHLVSSIAECSPWSICLPKNIIRRLHKKLQSRVIEFDFTDQSYVSCDLVICRPGIGTLTECVKASIPMVFVYEDHNNEMKHNAERCHKLGLGINLGYETSIQKLTDAIQKALEPAQHYFMKSNINKVEKNGSVVAADWLISKL